MEYLLCKSQMHLGKWQFAYLVQSGCQWCNSKHQSNFFNGNFEYFSGANLVGKITFLSLMKFSWLHHKGLGAFFESCWRHLPVWASALLGVQSSALAHAQNSLEQPDSYHPPKKLKFPGGLESTDILKKHPAHTQKALWKTFCGCFFKTDSGEGSATHLLYNSLW